MERSETVRKTTTIFSNPPFPHCLSHSGTHEAHMKFDRPATLRAMQRIPSKLCFFVPCLITLSILQSTLYVPIKQKIAETRGPLEVHLTSATRCQLRGFSRASGRERCAPSVHQVHFIVKNLEWGSAQQRGIQPAYALRELFGLQTSVIDCPYFCTNDNLDALRRRVLEKTTKHSVFIHVSMPCSCVIAVSKDMKAIHILEVMDNLGPTPAGFDQYIVASESIKDTVLRQLGINRLQVPVTVVPSFDSNLLGRGDDMRNNLRSPVEEVLYMGSKPQPEMVEKVRTFLASRHPNISFNVYGPELADEVAAPLKDMKEAGVEQIWKHSVAYSDVFAKRMSERNAVAIVWDQCQEYPSRYCPPDLERRCLERQRELCLNWKDDGRLVVHLAMGLPTIEFDDYSSHKYLLNDSGYPLAANNLEELTTKLDNTIRNASLRATSSSIGLDVTTNMTICSGAEAYLSAICKAVQDVRSKLFRKQLYHLSLFGIAGMCGVLGYLASQI